MYGSDDNGSPSGKGAVARAAAEPRPWVSSYVSFLHRNNRLLLAIAFALTVVCGIFAPQYFFATKLTYSAPPGSRAAEASHIMDTMFQQVAGTEEIIVLVWSSSGDDLLTTHWHGDAGDKPILRHVTDQLNVTATAWSHDHSNSPDKPFLAFLEGYLLFADEGLTNIADAFIANNNSASLLIFTIVPENGDAGAFVDWLLPMIHSWDYGDDIRLQATGMQVFEDDVLSGISHDFSHTDSIVVWVALGVLATVLRSPRLMLIPIMAMACSVAFTFFLMWPVAKYWLDVINFAPDVTVSAIIAMSIDESLFLLTRFREEVSRGHTVEKACAIMLTYAGHTILVTGTTLALCFFALGIFPLSLMRSVGISSGVGVMMTLVVNCTIAPLMLLAWPKFFTQFGFTWLYCCVCCPRGCRRVCCACRSCNRRESYSRSLMSDVEGTDDLADSDDDNAGYSDTLDSSGERVYGGDAELLRGKDKVFESPGPTKDSPDELEKMRNSLWYKFGNFLVKWRFAVIVAVLGLAIPCTIHAVDFERLIGLTLITPRNAEATTTFDMMAQDFSAGRLFPYRLIVQPNATAPSGSVLTQEFFTQSEAAVSQFVAEVPGTDPGSMEGILWYEGAPASFMLVEWGLTPGSPIYNTALGSAIRLARQTYVSMGAADATYVNIYLKENPFSIPGRAWLTTARAEIDKLNRSVNNTLGLRYMLGDGATIDTDNLSTVYTMFPGVIGISLFLAFLLVGFAMKSLLIPLRSVASIALTLAWVYGLLALTYQYGALNWTGLSTFKSMGGVAWTAPVMSFSILVGLGLDYDTFLLMRVQELRMSGMTEHGALVKGLYKTGSIITAAGLVMAVAFGGLLASSIPSLDQLSFSLVSAVLLDTFVIRSCLVPAIVSLLGPLNWWPRKMPPVTHDEFGEPVALAGQAYDEVTPRL